MQHGPLVAGQWSEQLKLKGEDLDLPLPYPTCCPLVRFSHIGSIEDAARDGPCAHGKPLPEFRYSHAAQSEQSSDGRRDEHMRIARRIRAIRPSTKDIRTFSHFSGYLMLRLITEKRLNAANACLTLLGPAAAKRQPSGAPATRSVAGGAAAQRETRQCACAHRSTARAACSYIYIEIRAARRLDG